MQKRICKTCKELTEKQWKILEPLFPEPIQSRKGGQNELRIEPVLKEYFVYFEQEHDGRTCRIGIPREVPVGVGCRNGRKPKFWSTFGKNSLVH